MTTMTDPLAICWVCRHILPHEERDPDAFGAHDECKEELRNRSGPVRVE